MHKPRLDNPSVRLQGTAASTLEGKPLSNDSQCLNNVMTNPLWHISLWHFCNTRRFPTMLKQNTFHHKNCPLICCQQPIASVHIATALQSMNKYSFTIDHLTPPHCASAFPPHSRSTCCCAQVQLILKNYKKHQR